MATIDSAGSKIARSRGGKSIHGEHFNVYLLALVLLILATGVVASLLPHRGRKAA